MSCDQTCLCKKLEVPRPETHSNFDVCSWVGLVSKNYEIERACVELEQDLYDIQKKGSNR